MEKIEFKSLNPFLKKIKITHVVQNDVDSHIHDFFELVYVVSGSAKHTINNVKTSIKKGDYFIIDFGTHHSYSECHNFNIINCLFKPEFIDRTLIDCTSFSRLITNYLIRFNYTILNQIPVNNIFHDDNNEIQEKFKFMIKEYENKSPGYIELLRCSLIETLVLTMRNIAKSDKFYQAHPATVQLMEYIDENFAETENLGDLCKKLNFTLPYVSRRFKSDTGFTYNQFLQKTRIEQSCRLLLETNTPIIEIAQRVGYNDIKFFGKIFKQNTKMTPSEFRKNTKSLD